MMRSCYSSRFVPLVLVALLLAACSGSSDESADPTLAVTTVASVVVMADGSSSGDEVVELSLDADAAVVTFTHDGSQRFSVSKLDGDLAPMELLVDAIGSYEGTRPVWQPRTLGGFEILADGDWTYAVVDLDYARHEYCPIEGNGDDLVVIKDLQPDGFEPGDPLSVDITFDGDTVFDIWIYGFSAPEHLIETTGPYEDTIIVTGGMVIWEILANGGAWTINCERD